jgi:hypothetical protein
MGSEWEPIKILLQRENSIYAPNSQPRIPTRVCQGHVVTTDLPTLGTNPKQSRSESETQEAKDLATLHSTRQTVREAGADGSRGWGRWSADTGRTIRDPRADSPLNATELPEAHPEMRAVHTLPADCPRATCAARTVRDLRADGPPNLLPQNFGTSKIYARALKNWTNTRRTLTSRTVRGLQADSPPALEQNSPRWKTRSQPPVSHHGSPKRLELLRKDLGEKWTVPRGCYAPKLGSSNEPNCRESNRNRAQPKT